jgi:hypothetical protein
LTKLGVSTGVCSIVFSGVVEQLIMNALKKMPKIDVE